jgi:hypothetical protein
MSSFYKNIRASDFLGHNILTERVFVWVQHFDRRAYVTKLHNNMGMSVRNCVGYDRLPSNEQHFTFTASLIEISVRISTL